MNKKQVLLLASGLTIISLNSPIFGMEKINQEKQESKKLEIPVKIQVLQEILKAGATITEEDLLSAKENDPEIYNLYIKTLAERNKKEENKAKEKLAQEGEKQESKKIIDMDEKLEYK